MITGTINSKVNEAIQFGRITSKEDVVGIKDLQEFLNKYYRIDIQFESLRERVIEVFKQRQS